jgi:hypothetical protein
MNGGRAMLLPETFVLWKKESDWFGLCTWNLNRG